VTKKTNSKNMIIQVGIAILLAVIVFFVLSFIRDVSLLPKLKKQYPVVRYQGPQVRPKIEWSERRPVQWVLLQEVSTYARGAIVVSEDWAFWQHPGYDLQQIKEAIKEDLEEKEFARGASTITQQVVKNVFLSNQKSLIRKIKEFFLAMLLEKQVGKKRILETYLNIAEWGEGIFGIQKASYYYFKKPPSQLTPREGAFLAMLLPSPKRYSQSYRNKKLTRYAQRTVNSILGKMCQARFITDEQKAQELEKLLIFEENSAPSVDDPIEGVE
jgi:monofunctional biosynthetic peptidoglycan transglycosylase